MVERFFSWAVIWTAFLLWWTSVPGCADDKCRVGTVMTADGHCQVPTSGGGKGGAGTGTQINPSMVAGRGGIQELDAGLSRVDAVAGSGGSSGGRPPEPAEPEGGGGGTGGSVAREAGHAAPDERGGAGGEPSEPGGGGGAGGGPAMTQPDAGEPIGGSIAPPPDAGTQQPTPRCGDGHTDPGEVCDGFCPLKCDDGDPCTSDKLVGLASTCDARCEYTPITAPANGDKCCPAGANASMDTDCPASCGDGHVDPGETCDGKDCPTPAACDDGNPCTTDKVAGSAAQCTAACAHTTISAAIDGDKCCPSGANATTDSDCKPVCGNSVKEQGETCDGNCPTSCPAPNGCILSALSGSASACSAACTGSTITARVNGDGCCPSGGTFNNDSDCSAPAGCSRQSAGNMLVNPGFATDLSGWKVEDASAITWNSGDYESCTASGSVQFVASGVVSKSITQCVPISSGTYFFSARIKGGGDGGQTTCTVDAFQLSGCAGSAANKARVDWLNVNWGPTSSNSFTSDSFASAKITCFLDGRNASSGASELDFVYLGRSDSAF